MRAHLLAIAVALAGCGAAVSSLDGDKPGVCDGCQGCCDGLSCYAGNSDAACGTASGRCEVCGIGSACTDGTCVPMNGYVSHAGEACRQDEDCGPGGLCAAEVVGGGYCTADCTRADCPPGDVCVDVGGGGGLCLRGCEDDAGCRKEHFCYEGVCLPRCMSDADCESLHCDVDTGLCGTPVVGAACLHDVDCGAPPLFCAQAPGGYCTASCGGPRNADCPPGSFCSSSGGGSLCLAACTDGGDCREGYVCSDEGAGKSSCQPRCTSDDDCGADRCDVPSGLCVKRSGPDGGVGAACEEDADCSGTPGEAFCSLNSPGGFCTTSCTDDPALCPEGSTCVKYPSGNGYCEHDCDGAEDCRPQYACQTFGEYRGCFPRCVRDADCDPQRCDESSGTCYDPAGEGVTVDVVDLTAGGPFTVDPARSSTPLTIQVPPDAISVTFVGDAVDRRARIAPYRIVGPDGATWYDGGRITSRMRVFPPVTSGSFAVAAPLAPDAPVGAGTWSLSIVASVRTNVTVRALIKRASTPPNSARLDLNLFFVGVPDLDAARAPADPDFQVVLGRMFADWGAAGIEVGEVRYLDLDARDATTYADLRDSKLGSLVALSADDRAKESALNVFFVRTISGGTFDGYVILGESAGIPGAPVNGTTSSGVAVSMADFPAGAADIGGTLAHEAGHFLGLFHTTEASGTSFDPLGDTDECPANQHDENGNGLVEPEECVGLDADDLMFWTSGDVVNARRLTPNQWFVLLRSPLAR